MMRRVIGTFIAAALLAGCETVAVQPSPNGQPGPSSSAALAVRSFHRVVSVVEPVAERECRARTSGVNCDFKIAIDDRPNQQPNAFQSLDRSGRPLIVFNLALIGDARNEHELAFVMGHEAAHHIAGHLGRQQQHAIAGAVILAGLATLGGADANAVKTAQKVGAQLGARRYSKDFELEADALGTIITKRAGYDPLVGAEFFTRIPDPGDQFLGTHPPNRARIAIVRKTLAGM